MFDHGLTTSMKDPHFTDLPLGPLAGATLRYTLTRRGSKLHGNHQCGETAKPDATIRDFPQPHSGTLGDLNLPGNAHCHLDEASAAYITMARDIARLRTENTEAQGIWSEGGFPLQITKAATMADHDEPSARGAAAALRDAWDRTRTERLRLIETITGAWKWQADEVLQVAIAARWVAAGRRPRAYDRQFDLFLEQADSALRLDGYTSGRGIRDLATDFLTHIAEGRSLDATTSKLLAASEKKPTYAPSGRVPLQVVLHTWGALLKGIVHAHPRRSIGSLTRFPGRFLCVDHAAFAAGM